MLWKLKETQRLWLEYENGTIIKDRGGKVAVALAFPNRYHVGMSNLGFQTIYGLFNARSDVVCERIFFPEPHDISLLDRHPGSLMSVESQKAMREFDLIVFSVPFEADYVNVLKMLKWANIPLRAKQRTNDHPLVAFGGVTAFLNPQVLSPFMDFVFVGEGEVFCKTFWEYWQSEPPGKNRKEWLTRLAISVNGIYVPQLYSEVYTEKGTLHTIEPKYEKLPKRIVVQKALTDPIFVAHSIITTPKTEFSNVKLVEIGRGCGRGCRFCAAGFIYRPPRTYPARDILSHIVGHTRRCGLVSAAMGDHPEIEFICKTLTQENIQLSFSSLRADSLTFTMAEALSSGGHQSVAIAPEAGSERLRRVINKKLSEETIINAVATLVKAHICHIKLYFMIGLPTETRDDIEEINKLVKKIHNEMLRVARGAGNVGEIIVNVNCFVPKPFTPFQWEQFERPEELKARIKMLRTTLGKLSNVRFYSDVPKWSYVQSLLSRGDSRVSDMIERVVYNGDSWHHVMRQVPWNPDFWAHRKREQDEFFPWDIIDHGIRKHYFHEEYERALKGVESPACPKDGSCKACGACGAYHNEAVLSNHERTEHHGTS